jgi:hypothetical protein
MTQAMTSRRIPSRRACSDRRCGAPRSAVRRGTSTVTVPRSTIARHFVSCFVDREPRIEQVIHGLLELVHGEPSSLFDREYELSAGVPAGCALMRLSCIHERI